MLRCLLPIPSSDKPNTYTMKLTKAILEAHSGRRECGLSLIVQDVFNREIGKFGEPKPCSLVLFLYYTRTKFDCLINWKRSKYEEKVKERLRTLTTYSDRDMEFDSCEV